MRVMLLACLPTAGVALAQEKKAPEPLPERVVTAWKAAGASVGWMGPGRSDGSLVFSARLADLADAGARPAFFLDVTRPRDAAFSKLPAPTSPFGLYLRGPSATDARLRELAGLKNLVHLGLFGKGVTDAGLKDLARLDGLAWLDLATTEVTDEGLKHLAPLKKLAYLKLPPKQVTDRGLRALREAGLLHALSEAKAEGGGRPASLGHVSSLFLGFTKVGDEGLKELAEMTNLASLHLRNTKVTDAGMTTLSGSRSLTSLNLHGLPVTDEGLKTLGALKGLKSLSLGDTKVTQAGLKRLAAFKNLTLLFLIPKQLTDGALKELRELGLLHAMSQASARGRGRPSGPEQVDSFRLLFSKVTHVGLKELAGLKNLRTLQMDRPQVTDDVLKVLREVGLLHTLSMAMTKAMTRPGSPEKVQWLDLSGTKVTGAGLKELAAFKALNHLYLDKAQLTDSALKSLREVGLLHSLDRARNKDGGRPASAEEVVSLSLAQTEVTDEGLKEVAVFKNLTFLNLNFTRGVTSKGVKELRKALPKCRVLGGG